MYRKLLPLLLFIILIGTGCQSDKSINYTIEGRDEELIHEYNELWSFEEYQWIQDNQNSYLVFACAQDYIPLEYMTETGAYGIGVNLLREVSKATGLKFKLYENNLNEEWHEIITSYKNKEIDILTTVSYSDERTLFLDFTVPYMQTTLTIVGHEDSNIYLNLRSDQFRSSTVAIPKGYWLNEYLFHRTDGNIDIYEVNNMQEAFDAINRKKADYTISEIPLFTYYRELKQFKNIRIAGEISEKNTLMMGIQKDLPILRSIIDKVILYSDRGHLFESSFVMPAPEANQKLLIMIFVLIFLIVIIGYLLYRNYHKLLTTKKQLEINIKQKEKFMEDISHDLRTPIMVTMGYIDTIADGEVQDKASIQNYLKRVQSTTVYMQSLVNDLFTLSKLENNFIRLQKEKTLINILLEDVISGIRITAEKKDISVITEISSTDHILLEIDSFRIRQALTNILYNAVKFTPQAGKIIISTKLSNDGKIQILVKDSGSGIQPEDLPHVFDRYYKSKYSTSPYSSGLGLCIAKQIVNLHGGKIWVESLPRQGSTFVIEL